MSKRLTYLLFTGFLLAIILSFAVILVFFPETFKKSKSMNSVGEEPFMAVPSEVLESIYAIEVYDSSDIRIATASGFVTEDPKTFVTCLHSLENMSYAICTSETGTTFKLDDACLISEDETSDIAIFTIPRDVETNGLKIADVLLKRGEGVTAVGTQFGMINVVTRGNASMVKDDFILFTAPVSAGASGGALLNNVYEVCGVIRGTYTDGQNINTAVPINTVCKLAGLNLKEDIRK